MVERKSPGQIVMLNGAPRSGKSSIVEVVQATFDGPWLNIGVDVIVRCVTPPVLRPGIGLRPGGEVPELEPFVESSYQAMYAAIAAHSRAGLNVVVDVGHHDSYSRPLKTLSHAARELEGLPVLFVGVRCPVEVIMQRRRAGQEGRSGEYLLGEPDDDVPEPVRRWQTEVHRPGIYDLEVDTAQLSPSECADWIRRRIANGPAGVALWIAAESGLA